MPSSRPCSDCGRLRCARSTPGSTRASTRRSCFHPGFRREHEDGFERLAREARTDAAAAEVFARRLDAILAFDARPLLQRIRCPTLVCAAHDESADATLVRREHH